MRCPCPKAGFRAMACVHRGLRCDNVTSWGCPATRKFRQTAPQTPPNPPNIGVPETNFLPGPSLADLFLTRPSARDRKIQGKMERGPPGVPSPLAPPSPPPHRASPGPAPLRSLRPGAPHRRPAPPSRGTGPWAGRPWAAAWAWAAASKHRGPRARGRGATVGASGRPAATGARWGGARADRGATEPSRGSSTTEMTRIPATAPGAFNPGSSRPSRRRLRPTSRETPAGSSRSARCASCRSRPA